MRGAVQWCRALITALLVTSYFFLLAPTNSAHAADCGAVLVSGVDWAGGNGVDARSNGDDQETAESCAGSSAKYDLGASPPRWGMGWQCVELAARLYKARAWSNGLPGVSYAAQIYTSASTLGMESMAQGAIDINKIAPGDMIVSNQATYGHVSIVDSVDIEGAKVNIVEQNASDNGRGSYSYDTATKQLSRGTYYKVTGVVHDPDNKLTQVNSTPQIFQVKRTADPSGVRQVYAATNTAVAEAWWVPGGNGVHLHEVINISQQNIVGFDKVNLPGGTQAVYTAVSDGVWESWWKPDGTRGAEKIVTELSGVKGVFAYNTTENGQFVHHLYILASDGPYEAWWKDGGDGVHLSRLTNINGGTTFTMSVAPGGQMQLYVATPTWVYEVWWVPGSNDVHVGTIINVTQGDIRAVAKAANLADGTQRLYTTTSTTVWQSVWGAGRPNIQTTAKVVSQTNAVMSEHMVTGSANQLYVATGNRVQEYWWTSNNSGGGTLTDIAQGNIGAIDKHNDGSTQQLYTGAGAWVYETWWGGGASPSTTGLFQVAH